MSAPFITNWLANAALNFDPKLGSITIGPALDGAQLSVEWDMLEVDEQPRNARQLGLEGIKSAQDNPWDRSSIDSLLKALANIISDEGDGEFHENQLNPKIVQISNKPNVIFSPALILRKRSIKGQIKVLTEIQEQIKGGQKIPTEFVDICEGGISRGTTTEGDEDKTKNFQNQIKDTELYFPKPYNEEQCQIVVKPEKN